MAALRNSNRCIYAAKSGVMITDCVCLLLPMEAENIMGMGCQRYCDVDVK